MRVKNLQARQWYEQEAKEQMWNYRTLDRNISTLYYERMLMSQVKESVVQEICLIGSKNWTSGCWKRMNIGIGKKFH